jgi:phospholipid/cholesterol/gamma-HCH transport system substrate-binding protein
MRNPRGLEVGVGVLVALGIAAFLMLALQVSDISNFGEEDGYQVRARFDNIGGLKARAPVTMAGVRIGRVAAIDFDESTFEAVVNLKIRRQFDKLPKDSSASVLTSGLLGEQYVGLEPGGETENLADGDSITITQSALVLEQVISRFLYSQASKGVEQ